MSRESPAAARYRQRASELRSMADRTEYRRALLIKAAFDYECMALVMQVLEDSKQAA
jgi:hypothetical protein